MILPGTLTKEVCCLWNGKHKGHHLLKQFLNRNLKKYWFFMSFCSYGCCCWCFFLIRWVDSCWFTSGAINLCNMFLKITSRTDRMHFEDKIIPTRFFSANTGPYVSCIQPFWVKYKVNNLKYFIFKGTQIWTDKKKIRIF